MQKLTNEYRYSFIVHLSNTVLATVDGTLIQTVYFRSEVDIIFTNCICRSDNCYSAGINMHCAALRIPDTRSSSKINRIIVKGCFYEVFHYSETTKCSNETFTDSLCTKRLLIRRVEDFYLCLMPFH